MSKKSALARKREAQEAKRRRESRLKAAGIGAVAFVVLAALIGTILYFTVFKESPPEEPGHQGSGGRHGSGSPGRRQRYCGLHRLAVARQEVRLIHRQG